MLFSRTLLTSAFAALVSSQVLQTVTIPASQDPKFISDLSAYFASAPLRTITFGAAQKTKARSDLSAYVTSVVAQPAYTAAIHALTSAVPTDIQSRFLSDPDGFVQSAINNPAVPSWLTAVPTSVQAYISNVGQEEVSIVIKAAQGPAPTNAARVAGAVMAAGGAALALL